MVRNHEEKSLKKKPKPNSMHCFLINLLKAKQKLFHTHKKMENFSVSRSTIGLTNLTLNFHSLSEGPIAASHTGQGPSACLWTMTPPLNRQPSSFCIQQNPDGLMSRGYEIINLEICFHPLTLKSHIPNCQKVQVEILLKTQANTLCA